MMMNCDERYAWLKDGEISKVPMPDQNTLNAADRLSEHLAVTNGQVITRFPPEPNGVLHIGHAKALNLSHDYCRMHNGSFILRFDDTNPTGENYQNAAQILLDATWILSDRILGDKGQECLRNENSSTSTSQKCVRTNQTKIDKYANEPSKQRIISHDSFDIQSAESNLLPASHKVAENSKNTMHCNEELNSTVFPANDIRNLDNTRENLLFRKFNPSTISSKECKKIDEIQAENQIYKKIFEKTGEKPVIPIEAKEYSQNVENVACLSDKLSSIILDDFYSSHNELSAAIQNNTLSNNKTNFPQSKLPNKGQNLDIKSNDAAFYNSKSKFLSDSSVDNRENETENIEIDSIPFYDKGLEWAVNYLKNLPPSTEPSSFKKQHPIFDRITFASDYFQKFIDFGFRLIDENKAFVCHQTPDEIKKFKDMNKDSPFKNRHKDLNRQLFTEMIGGLWAPGSAILRLNMDMKSKNPLHHDPPIFRVIDVAKHPHYRAGTRFRVFPLYDYVHCINDSLENITHSFCSREFYNRRTLYYHVLSVLDLYKPLQWEFSRLNIQGAFLSKRKILSLMSEGKIKSFDDPRLHTISALRRRGYTARSINNFVKNTGITFNHAVLDIRLLENFLREDLNLKAKRIMCVTDPLILNVYENEYSDKFTRVLIERSDYSHIKDKNFLRLTNQHPVGLMNKFTVVVKNKVYARNDTNQTSASETPDAILNDESYDKIEKTYLPRNLDEPLKNRNSNTNSPKLGDITLNIPAENNSNNSIMLNGDLKDLNTESASHFTAKKPEDCRIKKKVFNKLSKEERIKNRSKNAGLDAFKAEELYDHTYINSNAPFPQLDVLVSNLKPKKYIHWVDFDDHTRVEMRYFSDIIVNDTYNPKSIIVKTGYCHSDIKTAQIGDKYQFVRVGFFCVDTDTTSMNIVVNLTIPLKNATL